jgi:hypothetical protein
LFAVAHICQSWFKKLATESQKKSVSVSAVVALQLKPRKCNRALDIQNAAEGKFYDRAMLGQITDGVVRARSRSASIVSDDKSTKSTEAMGVSVQTLRPVKEDVPMIEEEVRALLYNLWENFVRPFSMLSFYIFVREPHV